MDASIASLLRRWVVRLALLVALAIGCLTAAWAFWSRGLSPLEPWHTIVPDDLDARAIRGQRSLAEYLAHEDHVVREVRDRIESQTPVEAQSLTNRYFAGSLTNPRRFPADWNRTFESIPAAIRGGALLVHGLTDGPYSMRPLARLFESAGFYALVLRMPGHGTVPAALTTVRWQDWDAAVRLGVAHVRERIGEGRPLVLVGYSNGAALVLNQALDGLEDPGLPRADRLVLVSPMIAVSPLARLSPAVSLLSGVPYFNRSAWESVQPEYNPFKYNSFPINAAYQSHLLTHELEGKLKRHHSAGRLASLPPVLTFQSIVDATVATGAVVERLYARLPFNGSALVMFDLNRHSALQPFVHGAVGSLVERLFAETARPYRLSVVTNASPEALDVVEKDVGPGSTEVYERALGLSWPRQVFSLSHVALPFPPDDPLYGLEPTRREDYGLRLGTLEPHGEDGVLLMSVGDLTRLKSNPFFAYLRDRVTSWIARI